MPMTDFTSDDPVDPTSGGGSTGGSGSGPAGPTGPTGPGGPAGPPMNPTNPMGSAKDSGPVSKLINYNEKFAKATPAKFRDDVIAQTMSVLISKNKPNPLLVGPAGVGKTRIVEDIARRIASNDPSLPKNLRGKTIYELPFSSIASGASLVGQLEKAIEEILEFISDPANKAILFLDEAHQLFASEGDSITNKIAQAFKPALARGDFHLIASTTANEAQSINNDPAMARRFSRLIVEELSLSQTREILDDVRDDYVTHYNHRIGVSDVVLDRVLHIAETEGPTTSHRPDSQLTLLDRAMAARVVAHQQAIAAAQASGADPRLVSLLTSSANHPLSEEHVLATARALRRGTAKPKPFDLSSVETEMKTRLCGQDNVIAKLTDALARHELRLTKRTRPLSWIFAGASGTGKTESVRIMAKALTDADPIILNMAEYSKAADINKITGSAPGYVGSTSKAEKPFDSLESNGQRFILLDEFEKAHTDVQRLFLSVLDSGTLRTAAGAQIDFSEAIIVATTNAGREVAGDKTAMGFASSIAAPVSDLSDASLTKALSEHFDKELLGRFTMRVAFNSIDRETFAEICAVHYDQMLAEITESNPKTAAALPASLDPAVTADLAEKNYVPALGARPARDAVRCWIEDQLLQAQSAAQSAQALPAAAPHTI